MINTEFAVENVLTALWFKCLYSTRKYAWCYL